VVDLRQAVAGLVRDGDAVAMEGLAHLIPMGAAYEISHPARGRGRGRRRRRPRRRSPSYAHDYYPHDSFFYEDWDPIARDRERFGVWMERHVLGTEDFAGYLESIGKRETLVAERSA